MTKENSIKMASKFESAPPCDGDLVLQTSVLPGLRQGVIDLSGAEDEFLDGGWVVGGRSDLRDGALELTALDHVVEAGLAVGVAEQGLGRHQDQGFPEGQGDLTCGKNPRQSIRKA